MIEPTKRRLTILFTVVILAFNITTLGAIVYFAHQNLMAVAVNRVRHEVEEDLIELYNHGEISSLSDLLEVDLFQLIDPRGKVAHTSKNPLPDRPPVDRQLVRRAFAGNEGYRRVVMSGNTYLDYYLPIDSKFSGRGVAPFDMLTGFEKTVGLMALIGLPAIFLISFFISRYLVQRALAPVFDMFVYQESFSSNITHELMSPLTSLKGNLEVALRKNRSLEEYQAVIQLGLTESDRIIDLLNNLFLLASSKFKPLDLLQEPVHMGELITEVVDENRKLLAEKDLNCQITGEQDLVCQCDRTLIRRSLANLWDNALKYSDVGGSIEIHREIWGVQAAIRFTNCFQNQETQDPNTLFEPFVRGAKATQNGITGKGLGLYIARYIARSHGGDLQLASAAEGKVSLVLYLPRAPVQSRVHHPERQRRFGKDPA